MLALCTRRTSDCTTSDIGGRNSGSGCRFQEPASPFQQCQKCHSHIRAMRTGWTDNFFTWTHRAMASAKRDRDLDGYSPCSAGSTIWSSASMSCSWGVAHLTSDCSGRGRDLQKFRDQVMATCVTTTTISCLRLFLWYFSFERSSEQMCERKMVCCSGLICVHLSNGFRPVRSSSMTTPKLYTSLFREYWPDKITSGALYPEFSSDSWNCCLYI